MGNLNRPINKYLLNAVASGTTDVDAPQDTKTGRYYFIHKGLGLAIPGNISGEAHRLMEVNVKPGLAGTAKKSTLELIKTYNPNEVSYEFFISIVRKPKFNGHTNEVHEVIHSYNYVKTNFSTTSAGEFDSTDTVDILQTLVARINADVALGDNNVSTGKCVTAAYVAAVGADPGPAVNAYITLTANDPDYDFEVRVDATYFDVDSITSVPVVRVPSKGKWDAIARIFPVKAEHAGTLVTTPIADTYYTEIEITQRSEGYDNVVPTGYNTVEQKTIIYVPNSYADALNDPIIAKLVIAALTITKDGVAWT